MRGCYTVSSLISGGRDKSVLLALIRDMPVGFLYIEGELAESRGTPREFLCSFINGWRGGESWLAPSIIFGALNRPPREPLWSESCSEGISPAFKLADSRAANSSASSGALLYYSIGLSSILDKRVDIVWLKALIFLKESSYLARNLKRSHHRHNCHRS